MDDTGIAILRFQSGTPCVIESGPAQSGVVLREFEIVGSDRTLGHDGGICVTNFRKDEDV